MNLIITCPRHNEEEASNEIKKILIENGEKDPVITITKMSGIITANIQNNPFDLIKKIRNRIFEEPWFLRYCLRIIPIQGIVFTEIEEISKEVQKHIKCIEDEHSFRITIEKRNSNLSKNEIITKIAESIKNKVSLEHPDWIILIEILGEKTGISVLKNDDILSKVIIKRSISD